MNTSWPDSTDVIHVEVNSSNYSIRGQDAAVTRRPLYLCLLVIPAFAIFGNLVVIIAIVKHRKLHTVTNYMILSLAVSDLIMGVATMPVAIVYLYLQEWLFGRVTCHLWHSSDVFASTASILNMCVISLDRYWAVTAPISYPRLMSKKRGAICLTFVWTCSLVVSVPVIAWWDSVDEFTQAQCLFTEDTAYLILSSLISFYIPVCIMIIVYAKIFKVIRLHSGLNSMRSDEGRRTQLRQTVTSTNLKDDPTLPMTDELYAIQPELSPLSMNQHNSSTILVKLAKAEVLRPIFFHQNSAQTKEDSKIRSAKQSLKSRVLSVNDYKQMKLKQRNEAGVARTLGLVLGQIGRAHV